MVINIVKAHKAFFIDRDWVLNKEVHHLREIKDLELLPWVSEWLKMLNNSGYLSIVITNQAAIAKWLLTEEYLWEIHKALSSMLQKNWAYLDDILYCPHHTEWIIQKFKIDCDCRKPKTWMIENAINKYNIDSSQSFLIWDTTSDIQTWINAWLKTILVKTWYAWTDGKYHCTPDFVFKDFLEAVKFVLQQ